MKKILVTGAGGFIGNKVSKMFYKLGYSVFGIDIIGNNELDLPIYSVDMKDYDCIKKILNDIRPSVIVHCAGAADVQRSVKYPYMDFESNVEVTHNLLFAVHECGLDESRMVFLSSASVYGSPAVLPISEDCETNPLSPYALHKLMCEQMCRYFIVNYGTNIKIARIFSAYGEGIKKQLFWDMYQRYKTTGKLEMFGTGDESRDYIHIDDVINAIHLLAFTQDDRTIFNMANGVEVTIRQAVECFAECSGISKDKISFMGTRRSGEPINWKADITRMTDIGFEATVDMKAGLNRYVQWLNSLDE